jgi:4-oxalocrotonate tautomerase family enzyme
VPYVQVTLTKGRHSQTQKKLLMKRVAEAVQETTELPMSSVRVWINEVFENETSVGDASREEIKGLREGTPR